VSRLGLKPVERSKFGLTRRNVGDFEGYNTSWNMQHHQDCSSFIASSAPAQAKVSAPSH